MFALAVRRVYRYALLSDARRGSEPKCDKNQNRTNEIWLKWDGGGGGGETKEIRNSEFLFLYHLRGQPLTKVGGEKKNIKMWMKNGNDGGGGSGEQRTEWHWKEREKERPARVS